jgi:small multidrug resistance pump
MREYAFLAGAIVAEITGTTALKAVDGFARPLALSVVVLGYGLSLYCLTVALEDLPLGLVYATWAAVGIAGVAVTGVVLYDESMDLAGVFGMVLIVAGVVVLNLYSGAYSPAH